MGNPHKPPWHSRTPCFAGMRCEQSYCWSPKEAASGHTRSQHSTTQLQWDFLSPPSCHELWLIRHKLWLRIHSHVQQRSFEPCSYRSDKIAISIMGYLPWYMVNPIVMAFQTWLSSPLTKWQSVHTIKWCSWKAGGPCGFQWHFW